MAPPLKLRARDGEDLAVISAMVQDALVPLGDMSYLADDHSFVLALNRFRWEAASKERIHAGLRFDAVQDVGYRSIDRRNRGQFLSFLAIDYDGDEKQGDVIMTFAGGGAIRLQVAGLYCILADLSEGWPTLWAPDHDLA